MLIWVTGALGMLGSAVCEKLEKLNISYIASDRKDANIIDLDSLKNFAQKQKFTHLINCVAYTNVDQAEKETHLAHLVNAKGAENIGKIAAEFNIKPIHFSTDYIFSGTQIFPYSETDIAEPLNVYGKTKYQGEELLLKECPHALIIRTSWLFGLNGNHFISRMLSLMQKPNPLKVVCDQFGRPTFCDDLVDVTLELLPYSGTFHFANKENTSWYDLSICIYEEAQKMGFEIQSPPPQPIKSCEYETLAVRPKYSVLNTQKVENTLGIQPVFWKEAVKVYLKKYFQTLCAP